MVSNNSDESDVKFLTLSAMITWHHNCPSKIKIAAGLLKAIQGRFLAAFARGLVSNALPLLLQKSVRCSHRGRYRTLRRAAASNHLPRNELKRCIVVFTTFNLTTYSRRENFCVVRASLIRTLVVSACQRAWFDLLRTRRGSWFVYGRIVYTAAADVVEDA